MFKFCFHCQLVMNHHTRHLLFNKLPEKCSLLSPIMNKVSNWKKLLKQITKRKILLQFILLSITLIMILIYVLTISGVF